MSTISRFLLSALLLPSLVYAQAWKSASLDGSTQYFNKATAVVSSYGFTMFGWARVANVTADHTIWHVVNTGSVNNQIQLKLAGATAGDPARFFYNNGGSGEGANSSTSYSASTWHTAIAVGTSATSRTVYLDNAGATTVTTSLTASGLNQTSVGVQRIATDQQFLNGQVAVPTLWNIELGTEARAKLQARIHPFWVERANIQVLLSFDNSSDLGNDMSSNNNDFTNVGTVTADTTNHPGLRIPQNFGTLGVM